MQSVGGPTLPSEAAASVWAKSGRSDDARLSLWRHLDDTAAVAGRLWDKWLPIAVRKTISTALPAATTDGRLLATWLAGVHDIGKATPAFAVQVPALSEGMRAHGLQMDGDPDRRRIHHSTAGQVLLEDWLRGVHGWERRESQQFSVVLGGHHGIPPTHDDLSNARRGYPRLLGLNEDQQAWQQVQRELLDRSAGLHSAGERLQQWRNCRLPQPAQALLTALVIVADWIASNDELFPLDDFERDVPQRLKRAWDALDLPSPWSAVENVSSPADFFLTRFALPAEASIRPVQQAAIELAASQREPGLLVIEAPMGEGKTEAALAVAELFAGRSGAGGCFIALPTRATSDAMFPRVLEWLHHVPDNDPDRGALSVMLAHGKTRLNEQLAGLLRRGTVVGIDMDGSEGEGPDLAAHQWLMGRKKAMLSSFVVGTIDQLLFGALKSKHVVLRHMGLAGKVVIIDEAHAYDVYMSVYLERALEWLGAYGVPVIVLSATLPAARRKAMVQAYDRCRFGKTSRPRRRSWRDGASNPPADDCSALEGDIGYPVLVASSGTGEPLVRVTETSGRETNVIVEPLADDGDALVTTLRPVMADGGCVLIIRNTVRRVQETARFLEDIFGRDRIRRDRITVAHSRFLALDRIAIDESLRDRFGPPERLKETGATRPVSHVVVASQVAEQSLDIDFDLLITDLAPVDLVLQRMGRLHRHQRERPEHLRQARCLLTGVDWDARPPKPVGGSIRVYGGHLLLRSLAVLSPRLETGTPVNLPEHIAPLVQAAYGEEAIGPIDWREAMDSARVEFERLQEEKRARADDFRLSGPREAGEPLIGWLHASAHDPEAHEREGRAQVRDTSSESVEVIVVMRRTDGTLGPLPWLPADPYEVIPTDQIPTLPQAKLLMSCTLALPAELCSLAAIEELEQQNCFPGWQESPWLEGQLVLVLEEGLTARLLDYELRYDRWLGLEVRRNA